MHEIQEVESGMQVRNATVCKQQMNECNHKKKTNNSYSMLLEDEELSCSVAALDLAKQEHCRLTKVSALSTAAFPTILPNPAVRHTPYPLDRR